MTWSLLGFALCAAIGLSALLRSRAKRANFYTDEVYGMTTAVHRRYAYGGFGLALVFLLSLWFSAIPTIALLTLAVIGAILYGTSFMRGAGAEDE
ncbi:MAG: hypothetical protein M3Y21_00735 [Candidatus Eremiobacteraeota bacterium]|nr:hypothetical protein [Candidatus Eremiobacteraeota bacterium]